MGNSRNLANLLGTGSTIATAKIADDAITSAKLADDSVVAAAIATDAVVADGLSSGAIQNGDIAGADLPNGTIIQVQLGNQTATQGSSSTAFTDTGMTVNITPTNSTNKIMVWASCQLGGESGQRFGARLVRVESGNEAIPGEGGSAGNRTRVHAAGVGSASNALDASLTMQLLDSPSTTNQLTYKVQVLSEGSTNYEINRSHVDGDSSTVFRTSSQICVMEVVA